MEQYQVATTESGQVTIMQIPQMATSGVGQTVQSQGQQAQVGVSVVHL